MWSACITSLAGTATCHVHADLLAFYFIYNLYALLVRGRKQLHTIHDPANGVHIEAKNWWDSSHDENPEARLAMAQEAITMNTNSTFVLCPRGNGPSSMRLVEAMGYVGDVCM